MIQPRQLLSLPWRPVAAALLLLLCQAPPAAATGGEVPVAQRPALAQALRQQLASLPSSRLVYQVQQDGKAAGVEFIFNRQRRYWLISSDINSDNSRRPFAYADLQAGRLLQFDLDKSTQASMLDLHELLRIDHPRNPWSLYARIIAEKSGQTLPGVDWHANQPLLLLNMQLDADKFAFTVGMSYSPVGEAAVAASWLAPALFVQAEKVVQTAKEVQVFLPKQHYLRIAADSGLLLEDAWKGGKNAKTRRLRLLRTEPLAQDNEAAEYQPELRQIQLKEARVDAALDPYFVLFAATLTQAGVANDIIASTLRVSRQEFMGSIAAPAAEYWAGYYQRELQAGRLDRKFINTFTEMLKRNFNQYIMDTADAQMTPAQYLARPATQNDLLQQFLPADMEDRVTIPATADLAAFAPETRALLEGSYRDALVAYTIGTVTGLLSTAQDHVLREGSLRNPLMRGQTQGK